MIDISLGYWNSLAHQAILTSSLLAGFSIAVIASLMVSETSNRFADYILKAATIAGGCFLISIFAWTNILMMSAEGFPVEIAESAFTKSRIIGGITLLLGVISLSIVIGLSGWIKSKSTGIFTSIVGLLTFLMITYTSTLS